MKYCSPLAIRSILSPDTPSMGFNKSSTNSQAQANSATASFVTTLHLIKAIKDALRKVRGNAWPVISYMQGKPCSLFRLPADS